MARLVDVNEINRLKSAFGAKMPEPLIQILSTEEIIGSVFQLSREQDASQFGVRMEWLTPEEQIEEATEFYPGMLAIDFGYVPVGKCLKGSGDPYFVKYGDGALAVFRVPHDCCNGDQFDEAKVEYICKLDYLLHIK